MGRLATLVWGVLALNPGAEAIEENRRWRRWEEIARRMKSLDALYEKLGFGPDARIGVLVRNRFDPYCAIFSVLVTERCLVTLNPLYPPQVLAEDIRAVAPPIVVGELSDLEKPEIREALAATGCAAIALTGDGNEPVRLLREFDATRFPAHGRRTSPGVIIEMLTSGTTGKPKRVPLKRASFEFAFEKSMAYESSRKPGDPPRLRQSVQLLTAPLAHIGGIWHAVFQLTAGRKACLLEKFEVHAWHDAVLRHRPKSASIPPAALRMVYEADFPREDLQSLIVINSATAPLDWKLADDVTERYGIPVLTNYGATEFSGAVAGWTLADYRQYRNAKRGSVGRLQQGVEARIVDPDTGKVLGPGQDGVLELRGAQLAGEPGDWLRTTDRAALDEDSFLWIKGRTDAAIIRGGFKVHPDDIASALQHHPAVREAAIVGLSDARLGQVPHAALLLKSGATVPSGEELNAFLRTKLAPYQIPVRYHILPEFPRTGSMKPALSALRDILSKAPPQ